MFESILERSLDLSTKGEEGHTPPAGVRKAAERGLKLRKEHGRGGTNVGSGRATQLASGRPVSLAIIKRMNSYFSRHEVDKQGQGWGDSSNPSAGYIAWLLWGGDAGKAWAARIVKSSEKGVSAAERHRKPTMPGTDEKFPIGNRNDVRRAVQLRNSTTEDADKVRRWITRRARELGCTDLLPEDWRGSTKARQSSEFARCKRCGSDRVAHLGDDGKQPRCAECGFHLALKVRHVRTPAGQRMYGQPIGSVIVADGPDSVFEGAVHAVTDAERGGGFTAAMKRRAERLFTLHPRGDDGKPAPSIQTRGSKHLWDFESDEDGFDMVVDSRNFKFYIARNDDDGTWSAWDSNSNEVTYGKNRAEVVRELDAIVEPPLKPGMKWATDADRKRLVIPPAWRDVSVATDRNARLQAIGYDSKGKGQYRYTAEHREIEDAAKFNRMRKLQPKMKALDAAIKKNRGKPEWDALAMVRALGMRPDTNTKSSKADVETFGATSLLAKHVKVTDAGLVTLNFTPGKKKTPVTIKVRDKELADMLRERLRTRKYNDALFDDVRVDDLEKAFKGVVGTGFKVKDLRTLKANALALQLIARRKKPPQTKTEFRKWRREVAQSVSDVLGNTPTIALGSYINPVVFQVWATDPEWL